LRLRENNPYSAAARTCRALGVRMVTNSSAAVGCSAMVASKSALVWAAPSHLQNLTRAARIDACRSISELSSAPTKTMMAESHIHVMRPMAAPSEP
jgi:hypothetical protein